MHLPLMLTVILVHVKGVVGDHQTIFTEEHFKLFDEMVKQSFPHGIPNALKSYPYLFN